MDKAMLKRPVVRLHEPLRHDFHNIPGDNLGRSERDEAVDVEEAGGGCNLGGLGGIGAAVPTTEVGVF